LKKRQHSPRLTLQFNAISLKENLEA